MIVIKMDDYGTNKTFNLKISSNDKNIKIEEILKYLKIIKTTINECRDYADECAYLYDNIYNRVEIYKKVIFENFNIFIDFEEINHNEIVDL